MASDDDLPTHWDQVNWRRVCFLAYKYGTMTERIRRFQKTALYKRELDVRKYCRFAEGLTPEQLMKIICAVGRLPSLEVGPVPQPVFTHQSLQQSQCYTGEYPQQRETMELLREQRFDQLPNPSFDEQTHRWAEPHMDVEGLLRILWAVGVLQRSLHQAFDPLLTLVGLAQGYNVDVCGSHLPDRPVHYALPQRRHPHEKAKIVTLQEMSVADARNFAANCSCHRS
eukprot:TRINITY_DN12588_c0_g1_i1.p1 TRINITY_DN12588_c0_g1~~TRINITY_DN12588_c0_g1_i1.p1  ORF type:complete len:226 (+),score=21.65 TRINITY_DN12588_c0_g1_i1:12-689(+)